MKVRAVLSFIVPLVLLIVVPARVSAQKTSYDFDRATEFSKYRTFAWREGTPAPEEFLDRRIVTAIESQLVARGLTRNDTTPDVFVLYHVALDTRRTVTGFNGGGFGPYPWGFGGGGMVDLRLDEVLMGTLVIDVVDAQRQELVWRGMGVGEIDIHAKPERRDASITKAVTKILKQYPPGRSSSAPQPR